MGKGITVWALVFNGRVEDLSTSKSFLLTKFAQKTDIDKETTDIRRVPDGSTMKRGDCFVV